jgi:ABC-2 type transport system ATP-binding protein
MTAILRERASAGVGVVFSSHQLDLVEDVCEDVVIINRGRIVAAGAIDDLRAASTRRHLEVEVTGNGNAWLDGRADLTIAERRDDFARLLVPADVDLAAVLAAASAAGPVTRFAFQPPTLSEIFMEVVRS